MVRADPNTGRIHIAFDLYTSIPVAAADARFRARLRFPLRDEAQSVVAITDLMLKLDRLLTRVPIEDDQRELVRLAHLSLSSPLETLLAGGVVLATAVNLALIVAKVRLTWYKGTKKKYEAQGIKLDNDKKRRSAQLEADRELSKAVSGELAEDDTPLLDEFASAGIPKGSPGSETRRQFIEAVQSAIELPAGFEGEVVDTRGSSGNDEVDESS